MLRDTLREMFEMADTDNSNLVSREEFTEALQNPEICGKMDKLQISLFDAEDLFDIIDVTGDGEIDLKEFTEGFSRVKGKAQGKHLLKLHYDIQRVLNGMRTAITNAEEAIDERLGCLASKVDKRFMDLD